jgi:hypothetical protein
VGRGVLVCAGVEVAGSAVAFTTRSTIMVVAVGGRDAIYGISTVCNGSRMLFDRKTPVINTITAAPPINTQNQAGVLRETSPLAPLRSTERGQG